MTDPIAEYAARVAAEWPEFSEAQLDRLAALLATDHPQVAEAA